MIDHFGYLHYEDPFFLNYGANVQDVSLTGAPSGVLSGTLTEAGTGLPLGGTVKVYRTDDGSLYAETASDSTICPCDNDESHRSRQVPATTGRRQACKGVT